MRIFVYFWIILLTIIGFGCVNFGNVGKISNYGGIRYQVIRIDERFGVEDRMEIERAIGEWNWAMNGEMRMVVENGGEVWKGEWRIIRVESGDKRIRGDVEGKYMVLALVNRIGGDEIYMIRDRESAGEIYGLVLHEIAHLMHLNHKESRLMEPLYDERDYACVDKLTIEKIAERYGIDIKKLRYCE